MPGNHLLRGVNQFLDLTDLRSYLAPFYSHTGRPSIDPELMIRMLIVGYCFGIRSERRLCEEVHLNLAYRWFCRLGLEDAVPEHSTFSKNRHGRFRESDAFRHVFETVLARCIAEGLVGAEGFAIDASVVQADAARASAMPGRALDRLAYGPAQATRAVREYLEGLDAEGRPESDRKTSLRRTRLPSGLVHRVVRHSSRTRRTTWLTYMPASSSMSRPPARTVSKKSTPRAP